MNAITVTALEKIIDSHFDGFDSKNRSFSKEVKDAVQFTLDLLDNGSIRVASCDSDGRWVTHQWIKKAILLSFQINPTQIISGGNGYSIWWDKIPAKFEKWTKKDFEKHNFRTIPGAIIRHSAYIAPRTVLMPSFVNIGAYIDEGTMVDTWSTIGSCAQIGKNVHISGGVGIGGVLEPIQTGPTIIEDNCFIGARSEIVEGCIIREGSVLGMGVFIGKSTKIIDRSTGTITYGEVPPYSVVVPGSYPGKDLKNNTVAANLYCAVIIKKVDEKTRSKTSINTLLRDHS
ncbi:2,3,4,5-tetrahydropyridine-2,6-carboxylate N-succinyltransferase [Candidatus Liberibacter solanacearum]|uniref:2,3,4,5-tetrahydropyridine-2,6-dicarboxylate N-succinyltransferase n=1 Tax=Candidatus Liberibacter solanacearum TaxID=556287 RepID=A0A095BGN6_9HYPH|nr:2,3,4,5-tetrahydropyridine-2,6-dicarboxylate N-succinyltransferase [Candidatus Liberibacter solanacearum]KGB27963.1 2,3,4,5-tetrahydropyridine-2,6-carboxylate N-succinyltransferase [Candidatus Liberibacter solanacearum]KJZ80959.1 2,3,4,5-tetrahydropyridine-2,6-carboxylate N-succinyltransferase [Candidatus Liberibacter solanacearum]KJZ82123.1 2,3,4,5-tetrahydropyridine-2,6-dicarboxylate N-succinyltransferase [Candidatus Liberibacter solanacearum]KQC49466.1 2,3,4,5-tetrahydropyridine-2,6-dicar